MTGDEAVRAALIRHVRWLRDVLPLNRWTESYLSSLHSLAVGHALTRDPDVRAEIECRLEDVRIDQLPRPIDDSWTQRSLYEAYEAVSHLPPDPNRYRSDRRGASARSAPPRAAASSRRAEWSVTNGLRVFGWTQAFTVPYALAVLADGEREDRAQELNR